jgi:hypothetical protein
MVMTGVDADGFDAIAKFFDDFNTYINNEIHKYNLFCEKFILENRYFHNKTVEDDLHGILNPIKSIWEFYFTDNIYETHIQYGIDPYFDHFRYSNMARKEAIDKFYKDKYSYKLTEEEFNDGLKARMYRTVFGVLTENSAVLVSKKAFGNEAIIRSIEDDCKGVDFTIYYKDIPFRIHIHKDSYNARQRVKEKILYKKSLGMDGIHVYLSYSTNFSHQTINLCHRLKNGFGVYTDSYIQHFKSEIDRFNFKDNDIHCIIYENNKFHFIDQKTIDGWISDTNNTNNDRKIETESLIEGLL